MKHLITDSRAIASKELRQLARDPVSLALTFLFPLVIFVIFILLFTVRASSYNIPIVVADLDDSALSKTLIDGLSSSNIVRLTDVTPTESKALGLVESGDATVAVVIPRGFSNLLPSGNAFIELAADNSKQNSVVLAKDEVDRLTEDLAKRSAASLGVPITTIQIIDRPISGRPFTRDPVLPGLLGLIIILGSFDDAVNAISRERERGTFPRLVLTQASVLSIFAGKTLTTLVLTALRTSLMLVIFILMGLVIRGNILLIYVTTSLMAIFTLGLGLTFSSRIRSSTTLTVLEIALTFPLLQLSGATRSPEILASSGRMIARLLPWTYGNEALRHVIYLGVGFDAIAPDLLILFLSSLVLLPIATALSKRTM